MEVRWKYDQNKCKKAFKRVRSDVWAESMRNNRASEQKRDAGVVETARGHAMSQYSLYIDIVYYRAYI